MGLQALVRIQSVLVGNWQQLAFTFLFFVVLLHLLLLRLLSFPLDAGDMGMNRGKVPTCVEFFDQHQNHKIHEDLKSSWKHQHKIK